MTVAVELTRSVDGPEVLATFVARGIAGVLEDDGLQVVVDADDPATVGHVLDVWAGEHGLPFAAVKIGRTRWALVPPAG